MEYKKVKRVGNNQAGFTFEVEVSTDTAEMTNGANFQNAEQVQQAIAQSSGGLVIETETTTTVKGFVVPVLTAEQVVSIYNAVASGKTVTITDPSGNYHFNIDQADNVSGEISVEYKFFNTMFVTYTLVDDTVTVTGELIGGGKSYSHHISFDFGSNGQILLKIVNSSNTPFTESTFHNYMKQNFVAPKIMDIIGMLTSANELYYGISYHSIDDNSFDMYNIKFDFANSRTYRSQGNISAIRNFNDNVVGD